MKCELKLFLYSKTKKKKIYILQVLIKILSIIIAKQYLFLYYNN